MLELDGGVADLKMIFQNMVELDEDASAFRRRNIGDGDVAGQGARVRAEAPDMQVMNVDNALDFFHASANGGQRDAARRAFEQDVESFADDADTRPEDERGDDERKDGIDPVLAGEKDPSAAGYNGSGGERVAGHMDKGRAHVHVAGHAPEQRGNHAVHQDAGGGHDHHQPGLHGNGGREAMDGLDGDPERDNDERGCVDESGQNAGALVAKGFGVAGGARLEVDGGKAEQQGEKVGNVMPSLLEQRQRVGAQTGHKGDHNIAERGDE